MRSQSSGDGRIQQLWRTVAGDCFGGTDGGRGIGPTIEPGNRDAAHGRRVDDPADWLQRAEAAFDPLPFDAAAARAYGRIYAAVVARGRTARGARAVDLLIAAAAAAAELPLCTRNPDDFAGLDDLVTVVAI
jgi:hypothetical protein